MKFESIEFIDIHAGLDNRNVIHFVSITSAVVDVYG